MNMEFSLKKSFKSYGSYQHMRRVCVSGQTSEAFPGHEESSVLLNEEPSDHDQGQNMSSFDNTPVSRREFTVKMDGVDSNDDHNCHQQEYSTRSSSNNYKNMRKGETISGSLEFMQQSGRNGSGGRDGDDQPSKLIGQFLSKQKNQGEIALDIDLEIEELNQHNQISSPPFSTDQSRELRVSFNHNPVESMRRRYRDYPEGGDQTYSYSQALQQQQQQHHHHRKQSFADIRRDEVLSCTSNASFSRNVKRTASLTKIKTRSRLQDPPPEEIIELRSERLPKSNQIKSGLMGKTSDEEDDDLLLGEDLPEEYTLSTFSAITFIQWVSLVLIVAALLCSLLTPELKQITLWDLKLWKWEVMVLVLICGRLVSGWGIRLIVFFIERNFVLRKKLLYFVYGIRKPVQNCLWLGLVLLTWHHLLYQKVERETRNRILTYIKKILVCLLIGTLLWLVKTLMVKVLASSFHVSTYFDRIQESLFYQYVIKTLSGPPLIEIQMNNEDVERAAAEVHKVQNSGVFLPPHPGDAAFSGEAKDWRVIGKSSRHKGSVKLNSGALSKRRDDGITIDHLHKLNPKNVSAWNMKRLINMVRHGSLSTLDEQILSDSANGDDSANQIRSECEAKAAARKIFLNVARNGSKYIYLEDLMRFMQEEEALKTMSLFEGATEHRRISKSALKIWVVNAFRERKALALTLNDTKTAVNKLHHIVNIIVGAIILIIWLLILRIATSQFLLFLSSQLVLVAFVFGNTCKTIFEALIFLFVMHPFDVGDRCEVDGVQMIVEEMNILTTVFLRFDNLKIIFPNSVLATKPIHNYYRSPDMLDEVRFCIHISTPPDKIALIKQRIVGYIEGKKEHWCSAPTIIVKDIEDFTRIRMAIWPTHKMNHQNMVDRWQRRALLVEEMVKIFRELDVQYRLFPLDINVRSVPHPPIESERMPSAWTNSTS